MPSHCFLLPIDRHIYAYMTETLAHERKARHDKYTDAFYRNEELYYRELDEVEGGWM